MPGTTPKAYLAGPDVFDPAYDALLEARSRACRAYGLQPLSPVDTGFTTAAAIYRNNGRLIRDADVVIANIEPFRGPHCDVGTAWEIGFAVALDKRVFAFSRDRRLLVERIPAGTVPGHDANGRLIENFGLAENLMIAESVHDGHIHPTFEEAMKAAARFLGLRAAA